ncbi:hypothetical protein CsSME_00012482 [Camellia sinensis var. sinensis]
MALIFLITPMLFGAHLDNVKMEGDNDIKNDNNHVQTTSCGNEVNGMYNFVSFPAAGLQIVSGRDQLVLWDAPLMTEDMHEE